MPTKETSTQTEASASVEQLLRQKRSQAPTSSYWKGSFEPRFMRRLMGEVARPQRHRRRLVLAGWLSPMVFAAAMALALGVAYIFSPERAISRWEAQTTSRDYVMDAIKAENQTNTYRIDHQIDNLSFEDSVVAHSDLTWEFSSSSNASASQF